MPLPRPHHAWEILLDPPSELLQLIRNLAPHRGQAVLHVRWNHRVRLPRNKPRPFLQSLQRLRQHLFALIPSTWRRSSLNRCVPLAQQDQHHQIPSDSSPACSNTRPATRHCALKDSFAECRVRQPSTRGGVFLSYAHRGNLLQSAYLRKVSVRPILSPK